MASRPSTFQIGFTGSTLDEVLPWATSVLRPHSDIVVAMAGSGKDIAALAEPNRAIYSWDTQPLSRYIVDGVFARKPDTGRQSPLPLGKAEGLATRDRPLRGMPDDAAALVDFIATEGGHLDRAALAKALIRSSLMGRLTAWSRTATAESLHQVYVKTREYLVGWAKPGTLFRHTEGSVFDDPSLEDVLEGSALYIDTPKVLTARKAGGDIYSQGFLGLNRMLSQDPELVLPAWTEDTFRRDMPRLWNAPGWTRMVLFHASGCHPSIPDVQAMLEADGLNVVGGMEWEHKGRVDVAWVVDR